MPRKNQRSLELPRIEQPVPAPEVGRPWFRSRSMVLTRRDWQRIDDAMSVACPYVQYFRFSHWEERADVPPDVGLVTRLSELIAEENSSPYEVVMLFDPDWKLEFCPPGMAPPWRPGCPFKQWTLMNRVPLPSMLLRYASAYRPASEGKGEYYYVGSFDLAIEPGNSGHVAFFRALFSLLGKFASNRHQTRFNPTTGVEYDPRERTNLWIGYEAIRWALEDPRRSFCHESEHVRPIAGKWCAKLR